MVALSQKNSLLQRGFLGLENYKKIKALKLEQLFFRLDYSTRTRIFGPALMTKEEP